MDLRVLYGGTFDPVHAGHLAVADAAAACLRCPIWLLPAGDPPLRPTPGADALQRAAMLDLAIAGHPDLGVDRRELQRPGPSYSVETLAQVRTEIGLGAPLAWLLGADALHGLPHWHRWRDLPGLAHLIVAARPGYPLAGLDPELQDLLVGRRVADPRALLDAPAGWVFRLDLPLRQEAASEMRAAIRAGRRWEDRTPPAVAAYIHAHGLYGAGPAPLPAG